MSYNVLKYGNDCQGSVEKLHNYLQTIVRYANPDVIGLVKVAAIKSAPGDKHGEAPAGFADIIRDKALNSAFPGRFAVAPYTNKANGNNINLLFYNQQKLGYAGMQTLVSNETDFNLFKLYVKSSTTAKDTAFLYVILNHTESGDKSSDRDIQMLAVMNALHNRFTQLPNVIDMGDFNLRNTSEPGYQALTNGTGTFHFSDPPFNPDHRLKYPADWESNPDPYAAYLTTSTRKKDGEPNDCGTSGGAKFWFDHILLSPTLVSGTGGLKYQAGSYHTIGNDGARTGLSVNAPKHPNNSVPPAVAEALFQFSNKYPVILELRMTGK
jgi:hypothetical protein